MAALDPFTQGQTHHRTALQTPRAAAVQIFNGGLRVFESGSFEQTRTAADALRITDRRVVEVARLIGSICLAKRAGVTPLMLLPIIDDIQRPHDSLIAFCQTVTKAWSTAPVRLAAVISLLSGGDADYIRTTYRSLVMSDFDAMSPVARSLIRAHINGNVRATDVYDMIARCLVVFDKKKSGNTKIQIKDTTDTIAKVKTLFFHLIPQDTVAEKKKAAPTGAAKSVLRGYSTKSARANA